MADTFFIPTQTVVAASWLNDVNRVVYRLLGTSTGPGGAAPTDTYQVLYALGSGPVVPSIATLRTLLKTENRTVFAVGYYASGDGGGGQYVVNLADVTSADNGGTIIVAADGGRWYLQTNTAVSIKQFGAHGNGVTDDTTAIQNALTWAQSIGGAHLYAPAGTYPVSTALTWSTAGSFLRLVGAGRRNTTFLSTSVGTAAVFNFTGGQDVELSDMALSGPTSTPATGGYLLTTAVDHKFMRVDFLNYFNGASLGANVGLLDSCSMGNESIQGPISTSSRGWVVNGYSGGLNITNCVGFVPTITPFCGINIVNSGAVQITNSNIIRQGTNLLVNPGNGQGVASLQCSNVYFDSAQSYNVYFVPAVGGTIVRSFFTQCECSSAGADGMRFDGTGGTVNGVTIVSAQANFCTSNGITVVGANAVNIDIVGGEVSGNVGAGLSCNSGCEVTATALEAGSVYGGTGNGTGFFCDGTSTLTLRGCRALGNTTNYAVPGTSIVENNIGFVSANTGTSAIPNTGTSVVVTHGLGNPPGAANIQLTPAVAMGSNPIYIDTTSITSTTFTVRCASAASGTLTFLWRATCNNQQ